MHFARISDVMERRRAQHRAQQYGVPKSEPHLPRTGRGQALVSAVKRSGARKTGGAERRTKQQEQIERHSRKRRPPKAPGSMAES